MLTISVLFWNKHEEKYYLVITQDGGSYNLEISQAQAIEMQAVFNHKDVDIDSFGHHHYEFE